MKKFATMKDLEAWIAEYDKAKYNGTSTDDLFALATAPVRSDSDLADALAAAGYDLDDLVADGHAYEIDGHTNNGWLYEDEADLDHIAATGKKIELRKRG